MYFQELSLRIEPGPCVLGLKRGSESPYLERPGRQLHQQGLSETMYASVYCCRTYEKAVTRSDHYYCMTLVPCGAPSVPVYWLRGSGKTNCLAIATNTVTLAY